MAIFADAHDTAMKALLKLRNFADKNLEVVLFSGTLLAFLVSYIL